MTRVQDIMISRIWITFCLTYKALTLLNLNYKAILVYDMPAETLQYFSRLNTTSTLRRERLWLKYKCLGTS